MRKISLVLPVIFLAFCLRGMADIITLKDGTTIDGTITQQDDTQITVTFQASPTITDTRILKREDIAKIEKPPEDTLVFEQFKNLKADPWAVFPAQVDADIAALKSFLAKYPQSTHKAAAQALLNAFLDLQTHQQAGDVNLYGRWISKQVAVERDSEVQAQSLLLKMQASATQGDLIGALNTFNQLEKTYPGSRAYPEALGQVIQILSALQADTATAIATWKVTDDQWKQGVAITPEPEKSQMIGARQAELARYDSILDSSQKAGVKWPPFVTQSQKILQAIADLIPTEKDRIIALPLDKMNASLAESDKARDLIAAHNLPAAESLLKQATVLWPKNDDVAYERKTIAAMKVALLHPGKPTPAVAGARTPAPKAAGASPAAATGKPKPSAAPVSATPYQAPPQSLWQNILDFIFTIPGAVVVLICCIGLYVLTSYLQKSKRDQINAQQDREH